MTGRVLIAGAGPVGLTLALELTRYGVPVRLVDKAPGPSDTSRAVAVWCRTLELLDRPGVTADLLQRGNRVTAANILAGGDSIARFTFDAVASPYPFVLMIPQYETEAVLRRHLDGFGIKPAFATELVEIDQDTDGVTATLRGPDGTDIQERFSWLVACDGAHSVVRHHLGLDFAGDTIALDWTQGDFHLTGSPFPTSELATYWHEDGPLVFFPMTPDRFRVIAALGPSTSAPAVALTREAFQALIDRRGPGGITLTDTVWTSAFRINERQVGRYRNGRIFLAGDAAHVHSPAGGQGMNTGMQDAINLAWKLALVCRGLSSAPELLDSYDLERRPVGAEVIHASGRLTKMGTVSDPTLQHIRNFVAHLVLGLPPVQHAVADLMAEVSIGYPSSPLNGPSHGGGADAGSRVGPMAGEAPYGIGDTPRFSLRASGEAAQQFAAAFPTLVDAEVRPQTAPGIALVRPDGYLAASAPGDRWDELVAYLNRLAAPGGGDVLA